MQQILKLKVKLSKIHNIYLLIPRKGKSTDIIQC
jgi:hypothetical protein